MINVVFLGSRLSALQELPQYTQIKLRKLYAHSGGLLHRRLGDLELPSTTEVDVFDDSSKSRIIDELADMDFDLLISNGFPFILPVSKLRKPHQVFVNVHPTLLPDLKGKTPINGVFYTERSRIGATMHHMDDGIDSGRIIAQEAVEVTPDLDQGLVYAISFRLESVAFKHGMDKLLGANLDYAGTIQRGEGSYFNRTRQLQTIDIAVDDTATIVRKVKSFGIKGQGTLLSASGKTLTIYSAEAITNPYLIATFGNGEAGTVAFEYDGKVLLRTKDGILKITDFKAI